MNRKIESENATQNVFSSYNWDSTNFQLTRFQKVLT